MSEDEKAKRKKWNDMLDEAADVGLKKFPGNVQGAAKTMRELVLKTPALREAMLELLVAEACTERVRHKLHVQNQSAWYQTPSFDPTMRGERLRSAARTSIHYKLMDYALMGGLPLGLANKAEVKKNAEFQHRQAKRMTQTGKWLDVIHASMVDEKQLVRDVLTEDDLRELQQLVIGKKPDAEGESAEI